MGFHDSNDVDFYTNLYTDVKKKFKILDFKIIKLSN